MRPRPLTLAILLLTLTPALLQAANWPQWRGPNFDGSSPETNLPVRFSPRENVKWIANLPGPSAATPVIWGNHVFISSTDRQTKSLQALCLDRQTGRILWQHQTAEGYGKDHRSTFSSASPVTDGERVVFFYGNGALAAFDFSGRKLWNRNLQTDYGPFAFLWTFSSSPLLYQGRLYLQVLQRDVPVDGRGRSDGPNDSYLLALDPQSGRELWKQIRPSQARQESREAFTTPIPFTTFDPPQILLAGGDCLTGHDPASGRELWRWETWNPTRIGHWRLVTSPVPGPNLVLACAPKGAPVYAVKAGLQGRAQDEAALAWKSSDRAVSSDVSTPLLYQGSFYILNSDRRTLSRVEPGSGKILWTGTLDSRAKIESSPTGADHKIYTINHRGDVFVVAAADPFHLLHTASFGDEDDTDVRASIAVAHGHLFIRTSRKLYCVGP